jgi:hypothetical protein
LINAFSPNFDRCYYRPSFGLGEQERMTDEERQRAMDFIVEQQAKFFVDIDKLNESYRNAEGRFDRDERILKLMIRAGRRMRKRLRELDERFEQRFAKLTDALRTLAEAQTRTEASVARTQASVAHTTERLDDLIDLVREGKNGTS